MRSKISWRARWHRFGGRYQSLLGDLTHFYGGWKGKICGTTLGGFESILCSCRKESLSILTANFPLVAQEDFYLADFDSGFHTAPLAKCIGREIGFPTQKKQQHPKEILQLLSSFIEQNAYFFYIFFAGYDRKLPGFPRYSVLGSDDSGVFNLEISNATLEDDAVYECQVGPSFNNRPIRASARLNVMRKSSQTGIPFHIFEYGWQMAPINCVTYLLGEVILPFSLQCPRRKLKSRESKLDPGWAFVKTKSWSWDAWFAMPNQRP